MSKPEVITINDVRVNIPSKNDEAATLKVADMGVALNPPSGNILIDKDEISHIEIFRGIKQYNIRIYKIDKSMVNIYNTPTDQIEKLRIAFTDWYSVPVELLQLEVKNTSKGCIELLNKTIIVKNGNKKIFDIPYDEIENIVDVKNEIVITLKNSSSVGVSEITLEADDQFIRRIKEITEFSNSPDILTIEDVPLVYPRGKNDLIFYSEGIKFLGKTFEHMVEYKNIKKLYKLKGSKNRNETVYLLVLCLHNSITQGLTQYNHIAFQVEDSIEVDELNLKLNDEIKKRYPNVKETYTAANHEIMVEIIENFTGLKAEHSKEFSLHGGEHKVNCSYKTFEGFIFPLKHRMIFAPKIIEMPFDKINAVRFLRIDLSQKTTKTFDLKVIMYDQEYNFSSLNKDDFSCFESYFSKAGIRMEQENILEDVSSSINDDESSTEIENGSSISG